MDPVHVTLVCIVIHRVEVSITYMYTIVLFLYKINRAHGLWPDPLKLNYILKCHIGARARAPWKSKILSEIQNFEYHHSIVA